MTKPRVLRTYCLVASLFALCLTTTTRAWTMDEETLQLERAALCEAMPYRCPDGPPAPSMQTLQALQDNAQCAELAKHPAVMRRKTKDWKIPLDASGEAALRIWDTTCRASRHNPDQILREAATPSAMRQHSSTIDCLTTWDDGPYSSRLTTTCTSY